MFQCGFYEGDITSNIGDLMPGGFGGRFAEIVRDKLYVSAFSAKTEKETAIIIILDTAMVEEEEAKAIREGISERTGVPVSHINVSAIHTHGGGPFINIYTDVKDPEYCKFVVRRSIDAGTMAFLSMADAKIGVASKEVEGVSFTRRYLDVNGQVQNNPERMSPDIVKPLEEVDRELSVVRVDYADGRPMGMIANFALHPAQAHALKPNGITADFPGVMRKTVKEKYGDEFAFMFIQGASGNVNARNAMAPKSEQKQYQEIGRILATEAMGLFSEIETRSSEVVRCVNHGFVGRTCRPTPDMVEDAQVSENTKKEILKAMMLPNEDVEVDVSTLRIGDLLIHFLPGEYFSYYSLYLKEKSPLPYTMVCELANKKIGYICTKEAREMGGYDATPSTYIIMDADTGDFVLDAAMQNVRSLCCDKK